MRKILFFQHIASLGGAAGSLCQIVEALAGQFEVMVVLCKDGPARKRLEALGAEVLIESRLVQFCGAFAGTKSLFFETENRRGLLHYNRTVRIARQICLRVRPDIVYLNVSVLFPVAVGAKQAEVKRVIVHNREPLLFRKGGSQERIKNWVLDRCVDEVVSITQANADDFAPGRVARVIHNWVDFSGRDRFVDVRKEFGIPKDKKLILDMGGRVRCKGTLISLRAMQQLKRNDVCLLAVGVKDNPSVLKKMIRWLLDFFHIRTYGREMDWLIRKMPDRVRALPTMQNIQSVMQAVDVILFPFVNPHFSKGAIEAGALRKPVIINDTGVYLEGIQNGSHAVVCPPGDAVEFQRAVERLLTNSDEAAQLGRNFKKLVDGQFSKEESIRRLQELVAE